MSLMRIWSAIENKLQSFLFKDCLINLICLLFYFFIFRILDLFGYFMRWTVNKIEMIDFFVLCSFDEITNESFKNE